MRLVGACFEALTLLVAGFCDFAGVDEAFLAASIILSTWAFLLSWPFLGRGF